jgi:hypothetical protein
MRRYLPLLLLLVLLACPTGELVAQGCAMCKAVAQGGNGVFGGEQAIGRGLNRGILYLMAVPYALLLLFFRKRIVGFIKEFASAQG